MPAHAPAAPRMMHHAVPFDGTSMNDTSLRRTRLHDWHVAHGARMVAFAGWSMPVQYRSGVTREHIATRTHAGLFDICHMGRIRVSGPDAAVMLAEQLTNDPRELPVGRAHYTLLANERGGADDDAFLYRLAPQEFLLVVNASNRSTDYARLHDACMGRSVSLVDQTDALGMLALQGPAAEAILASSFGVQAVPPAGRNHVGITQHRGAKLVVARTGYTGERIAFELFLPADAVLDAWQALVAGGAVSVGLGARDSLRLEAGLPLHGHEFGTDASGMEIPIFANRIARFGVRPPGRGDYVGRSALDAQRSEHEAIVADALKAEPVLLPQLVQALAVFEGRRPLRAGYELHCDGERVGYVTSGTSVPVPTCATEGYAMRPIGLGLVRQEIRYRPGHTITLEVRDARETLMHARVVASNLPTPQA